MQLDGRVALVCGAGRGIGRDIALDFAREGADVCVADIDGASARAVAEEAGATGGRSLAVEVDLTLARQVADMAAAVLSEFQRIDIVVNNQGSLSVNGRVPQGLVDEEAPDWDSGYRLNLKSHFLVVKAVVPSMMARRYGKVLNISSIGARVGTTTPMIYAASKAGVITLTRALARELAPHGINVNCICPGIVYTPLWEDFAVQIAGQSRHYAGRDPKDIFLETAEKHTLLRREQTGSDIARAATFLVSDQARNITGQSLNADGGLVFDEAMSLPTLHDHAASRSGSTISKRGAS